MPEAVGNGGRGIRGAVLREMQPREREIVGRLLADLPRRENPVEAATRLAAAGSELVYLRRYVDRMWEMVVEGELQIESPEEERLFAEIRAATEELIQHIEQHLGSFSTAESLWRQAGVRETYLVEIAPERRESARWVVEVGHQASDAPEPVEPVGRMVLRAVGDDLLEVERYLSEAVAGISEGELRDLATEVTRGCGELALTIAGTLPPEPTGEAPNRGAEPEETG